MKKLLLIIPLLSYLFNQTVEIQSGAFQENSYLQGEAVYFNVHVKNTGSMTLSDLWLNVDISDPNSTNVIEGLWQYLPTLNPNETYETGYDYIWTVSAGATLGNYYAAISLRDISNVYDIEYGIDNFNIIESEEPFPLSEGKIVFHSYSDYEAWDGKLFLYDFSEQLLTEISQGWDIDHTINAHFSPDGSKIVFMGAPAGNHNSSSWDIYLWDLFSGLPINLTANNGLRDEDPKFSPNGNEIVFKQDGDLKVMDLINNTIIHTTNNGYSIEESMPYYTIDSQYIIYARGAGISSDIYLINKDGMENQPLENITNIQEYYPIIRSNSTFLYTRWVSAANHHDQIYLGYFNDTDAQSLSFNDESADASDPFPVNLEYVLFSSNRSGGQGGWDLYLADINSSTTWSMDEFNLNSSIHELGICYFSGVSINGCTDPEACNYDETATDDDGSCEYYDPAIMCDCDETFLDVNGDCCSELMMDDCWVCNGDGSSCETSFSIVYPYNNQIIQASNIYFQWDTPGFEQGTEVEFRLVIAAIVPGEAETPEEAIENISNSVFYFDSEWSPLPIAGGQWPWIENGYSVSLNIWYSTLISELSMETFVCPNDYAWRMYARNLNEFYEEASEIRSFTWAGSSDENYDCDGNCTAEYDCAGTCGGDAVVDECDVCGGDNTDCAGCTDPEACNYDENAIADDGSCIYSNGITDSLLLGSWEISDVFGYNNHYCEGVPDTIINIPDEFENFLLEINSDGIIYNLLDSSISYMWNVPDSMYTNTLCFYTSLYDDLNCSVFYELTENNYHLSISDPTPEQEMCIQVQYDKIILGCTDPYASNYNPDATLDDGSCEYDCSLGDVNCDGELNVLDVVLMVNMILADEYDEIGDMNGDGQLDILDVVILINLILNAEGVIMDIDGNVYQTVQIGEQLWMAENLKVTHYNDNSEIPTGYSGSEWAQLETGAYALYDDDPANSETYGNLYNWYTVDDSRGLCMEGWHVPTDNEWTILTDFLGGGSVAGKKMKSTGTVEDGNGLWYADVYSPFGEEGTDESGFSALPSGLRSAENDNLDTDGGYYFMGYSTKFWSSENPNLPCDCVAKAIKLEYFHSDASLYYQDMEYGYSIRCLKD